MRRNNWFMMAYIVFIFLSSIVKLFYDYPLWNTLVSAITVSSCFFALADNALNRYSNAMKAIDFFRDFAQDIKALLKTEHNTLSEIALIIEPYAKQNFDIENKKEELLAISGNVLTRIDMVHNLETSLKEFDDTMVDDSNAARKQLLSGEILTIMGFLCFLCISFFPVVASTAIKIQDQITVIAFGVILLTQFVQGKDEEEKASMSEKGRKTIATLKNITKDTAELKKRTYDLIESGDRTNAD